MALAIDSDDPASPWLTRRRSGKSDTNPAKRKDTPPVSQLPTLETMINLHFPPQAPTSLPRLGISKGPP